MSSHKMLSNLYPIVFVKFNTVSQPAQHVSGFIVLVKWFLVPNGTGCLIKALRDCSCVVSTTSDSALASSSSAWC